VGLDKPQICMNRRSTHLGNIFIDFLTSDIFREQKNAKTGRHPTEKDAFGYANLEGEQSNQRVAPNR